MFDDVFDEKQWKMARDKTGLKGSLTEKVNLGDEFKRFQQNRTVAGAKVLQQKIALYEKQLKEKHSQEKYYANLLKVVQHQRLHIENQMEAIEKPQGQPGQPGQPGQQVPTHHEDGTNADPNEPQSSDKARELYSLLKKAFSTLGSQLQSKRIEATEILGKCQVLEKNPNLQKKPDESIAVARKIVEMLHGIENQTSGLLPVFESEALKLRKEEGRETPATKVINGMTTKLQGGIETIAEIGRQCRQVLGNALAPLGDNPKAQEFMRLLHVSPKLTGEPLTKKEEKAADKDPNAPESPLARQIYLKMTKDGKEAIETLKSVVANLTEDLKKYRQLREIPDPDDDEMIELAETFRLKAEGDWEKATAMLKNISAMARELEKVEGGETPATKQASSIEGMVSIMKNQVSQQIQLCAMTLWTFVSSLGQESKLKDMENKLRRLGSMIERG
jgi:hypothetical protein